MNRLRAAYVEMDPIVTDYLVTSWHDDRVGMMRTHTMGHERSTVSHVVGSTAMFMSIVNTIVAGTLGALITDAAGGGPGLVAGVGAISGSAYLAGMPELGRRTVLPKPDPRPLPSPPDR